MDSMTAKFKSVYQAARQHGKSVLQNQVIASITDDDWTVWSPNKKAEPEPPVYLDFNTPPLALVISMQEAGKENTDIYSLILTMGRNPPGPEVIASVEHQAKAAEIYDYFAKKNTMRRIKGEYVSEYMLALEDLCENRKRINKESVKILVSLPRIYNQNRALERVMKGHKSAPKPNDLHFPPMTGTVEFVEKIEIKTGGRTEVHYYFSTPKNYLMRIVVKKGEYGETAWNTLSQAGKLHIDSIATYTYNIRGYEFNVIQPTPSMEISVA